MCPNGGSPAPRLVVGSTLALLLTALAVSAAEPALPGKGRELLRPLDYRGVRLEGGLLRTQIEEVQRYYLAIPSDDLLKGFRARVGRPAPGRDLGGWYSSDTFSIFGQVLSGLARLYAATGDEACREKVLGLMAGWAECIGPDGYFYFSSQPNAPHYTYDKLVGGLVDLYLYCDASEALKHLSRITDWAIANLDQANPPMWVEWYTLSENLYRAYLATGDPKYRAFAKVWEYTDYWNHYADGTSIFPTGPDGRPTGAYHAYSHVNTLGGAGAAYQGTGDPQHLRVLTGAYDYLQANQLWPSGGYGPNEQLLPPGLRAGTLTASHAHFETQCGSWAGCKMSKYLTRFTGDARYGDWVEKLALNGLGASIAMGSDGSVFYYSDYAADGGSKQNIIPWACCAGTRPMAVADVTDLIYYRGDDGLYVSQFMPSTVAWTHRGTSVTVTQRTRFPEEPATELVVCPQRPVRLTVALREPEWLARPMAVAVNGCALAAEADGQHWVRVERLWRRGDVLRIALPMSVWMCPAEPPHVFPMAFMYGPVMLAVRSTGDPPHGRLSQASLKDLEPSAGEPLTFRVRGQPDLLLRPFYAFKQGEPYYAFTDPSWAGRIPYQSVRFSDGWNDSGRFRFTNKVGAWAEADFDGAGIRWLGWRYDDGAIVEVTIDGQVVGEVDQYGPGRDLPFEWSHAGLAPGRHTIRLRIRGEPNPASRGTYANVAGFEAIAR